MTQSCRRGHWHLRRAPMQLSPPLRNRQQIPRFRIGSARPAYSVIVKWLLINWVERDGRPDRVEQLQQPCSVKGSFAFCLVGTIGVIDECAVNSDARFD